MLRCVITAEPLERLDPDRHARLNRTIGDGEIYNRLGMRVEEPLEAALIGSDQRWIYPIRDGIPQLLSGEAIAAEQLV